MNILFGVFAFIGFASAVTGQWGVMLLSIIVLAFAVWADGYVRRQHAASKVIDPKPTDEVDDPLKDSEAGRSIF